jgi:hypothetical protein
MYGAYFDAFWNDCCRKAAITLRGRMSYDEVDGPLARCQCAGQAALAAAFAAVLHAA